MEALKLASPLATSYIPSFNKPTIQTNGKSVKTKLYIQTPLRKPKKIHEPSKPQKQPETLNPEEPINGGIHSLNGKIEEDSQTSQSSVSDVLRLIDSLSLPIPLDVYSSLIKECTSTRDAPGARAVQAHLTSSGVRPTVSLVNRLLLMHVSCGHLDFARQMFDKMPRRNFHSWAIAIVGQIESGDYDEALALFAAMINCSEGYLKLPAWIMGCVLKACVLTRDLSLGKQTHALCHKLGLCRDNLYLSASLILLYRKFRCCYEDARFVLDQLSHTSTFVWTAKIANECSQGFPHEAVLGFKSMGSLRIKKNSSVFVNVLKACGKIRDGGRSGQQVHADALKLGFETDGCVRRGLIDMYGKHGSLRDARRVFEETQDKSSASCWKAMVAGYMRNGLHVQAIKLLYQIKELGIEVPDEFFRDVMVSCGSDPYNLGYTEDETKLLNQSCA